MGAFMQRLSSYVRRYLEWRLNRPNMPGEYGGAPDWPSWQLRLAKWKIQRPTW